MTSDHTYSTGFNWDQLVNMPTASEEWHKGRQVLNFYPMDKDYRDSQPAQAMVTNYFDNAKALNTDAAVLKFGSDHVTLRGAFLEMGVLREEPSILLPHSIQRNVSGDSIPLTGFLNNGRAPILLSLKVLFGLTSRGGCHRFFTT